jgi:hypothetical protein
LSDHRDQEQTEIALACKKRVVGSGGSLQAQPRAPQHSDPTHSSESTGPEMNLARTIGVGAGFLGILAYEHVIPVRLAVLTFWLFASCLVYLVFIWPDPRGKK